MNELIDEMISREISFIISKSPHQNFISEPPGLLMGPLSFLLAAQSFFIGKYFILRSILVSMLLKTATKEVLIRHHASSTTMAAGASFSLGELAIEYSWCYLFSYQRYGGVAEADIFAQDDITAAHIWYWKNKPPWRLYIYDISLFIDRALSRYE